MEQILREPVELTDGDLHLVAGGTASAAAASGTNQAAAVSAAGAASEVFSSPLAIEGFTGVGTTTAAAIGRQLRDGCLQDGKLGRGEAEHGVGVTAVVSHSHDWAPSPAAVSASDSAGLDRRGAS